ncbi:MAG: ferrous iron transport protein A [Vallitaleaceae bacterium]|nr:ferrous iron transport protein A [Vallitaleaceae bacterium]
MQDNWMPLHLMPCGKTARVCELTAVGNGRRRLQDLGLVKGTQVLSLRRSPSGDPTAYEFRGAVIALRSEDASKILVELIKL